MYNDSTLNIQVYREKERIEWFVNQLNDLAIKINFIFQNIVPMKPLTVQQ